jgi:hypothetical protein
VLTQFNQEKSMNRSAVARASPAAVLVAVSYAASAAAANNSPAVSNSFATEIGAASIVEIA